MNIEQMVDTQEELAAFRQFFFLLIFYVMTYYTESRCGHSSRGNSDLYRYFEQHTVCDNIIKVFALNYMVYKCAFHAQRDILDNALSIIFFHILHKEIRCNIYISYVTLNEWFSLYKFKWWTVRFIHFHVNT